MTTQINKPIATAEDLFKNLIWDSAVKAGENALFAAAPWLAIWPIGPVLTFALGYFSGQLFDGIRTAVDMEAIVLLNDAHKTQFADASLKLKVIAEESGVDSPEFKEARNAAAQSLSQFVRFIGS
jgi:hypothetical protein